MGPPPRSFAIDAQYCIMVRVKKDPPDTSLRREHTRQKAGSTRIIFETVSPPGESASVLAAVKDKPAVAAENAATLDRRCARRRESNAVGAEECSQRGSNKRMDYKDQVSP
jgi:hypothetical protein